MIPLMKPYARPVDLKSAVLTHLIRLVRGGDIQEANSTLTRAALSRADATGFVRYHPPLAPCRADTTRQRPAWSLAGLTTPQTRRVIAETEALTGRTNGNPAPAPVQIDLDGNADTASIQTKPYSLQAAEPTRLSLDFTATDIATWAVLLDYYSEEDMLDPLRIPHFLKVREICRRAAEHLEGKPGVGSPKPEERPVVMVPGGELDCDYPLGALAGKYKVIIVGLDEPRAARTRDRLRRETPDLLPFVEFEQRDITDNVVIAVAKEIDRICASSQDGREVLDRIIHLLENVWVPTPDLTGGKKVDLLISSMLVSQIGRGLDGWIIEKYRKARFVYLPSEGDIENLLIAYHKFLGRLSRAHADAGTHYITEQRGLLVFASDMTEHATVSDEDLVAREAMLVRPDAEPVGDITTLFRLTHKPTVETWESEWAPGVGALGNRRVTLTRHWFDIQAAILTPDNFAPSPTPGAGDSGSTLSPPPPAKTRL